jgi:hypothetical protein
MAIRFAGTICAWKAKTSRLFGSTSALTQWTSLLPLPWLSPKVSTRVKFSTRRPDESWSGLSTREVVGVAVDVDDRLLERGRQLPELLQEVDVAVGRTVGLGQRPRVTRRARVASEPSKPGSAWPMIITPAESCAAASSKIFWSHIRSAALRACRATTLR